MKILIKKIIIWLFDKYAFDEWIDIQQKNEREDFKKKYNLKDDEIEEAMIDEQQEPCKEAYEAGVAWTCYRKYQNL